jgi:hypothetical protein
MSTLVDILNIDINIYIEFDSEFIIVVAKLSPSFKSLIGETLGLVSVSRLKAQRLSVSVSFLLLISLGLGLVR